MANDEERKAIRHLLKSAGVDQDIIDQLDHPDTEVNVRTVDASTIESDKPEDNNSESWTPEDLSKILQYLASDTNEPCGECVDCELDDILEEYEEERGKDMLIATLGSAMVNSIAGSETRELAIGRAASVMTAMKMAFTAMAVITENDETATRH